MVALFVLFPASMLAKGDDSAKAPSPESNFYGQDYGSSNNAILQGASMGTIGPAGADVYATNGTIRPQGDNTVIQGIMTAGTVRVNNLANLEAALNIAANAMEIIWILLATYHLFKTIKIKKPTTSKVMHGLATAASFLVIGLATPGVINYAVAESRDAALFN